MGPAVGATPSWQLCGAFPGSASWRIVRVHRAGFAWCRNNGSRVHGEWACLPSGPAMKYVMFPPLTLQVSEARLAFLVCLTSLVYPGSSRHCILRSRHSGPEGGPVRKDRAWSAPGADQRGRYSGGVDLTSVAITGCVVALPDRIFCRRGTVRLLHHRSLVLVHLVLDLHCSLTPGCGNSPSPMGTLGVRDSTQNNVVGGLHAVVQPIAIA